MTHENGPVRLLERLREQWLEPIVSAPVPEDLMTSAKRLASALKKSERSDKARDPGEPDDGASGL
jgi:hypothetical protein